MDATKKSTGQDVGSRHSFLDASLARTDCCTVSVPRHGQVKITRGSELTSLCFQPWHQHTLSFLLHYFWAQLQWHDRHIHINITKLSGLLGSSFYMCWYSWSTEPRKRQPSALQMHRVLSPSTWSSLHRQKPGTGLCALAVGAWLSGTCQEGSSSALQWIKGIEKCFWLQHYSSSMCAYTGK